MSGRRFVPPGGLGPDDPRHGTWTGYGIHKALGEDPCDACRRVVRDWATGQRRARGQAPVDPEGRNAGVAARHERERAARAAARGYDTWEAMIRSTATDGSVAAASRRLGVDWMTLDRWRRRYGIT